MLNDGSGHFTQQTIAPTGQLPVAIAIGDLSGSGTGDIAVANASSGTVVLFVKAPANPGTYSRTTLRTGSFPNSVAIGDLSGHGAHDLITANAGASNVSIFLKDPTAAATGGYTTTRLPTGSRPIAARLGKFGGDGLSSDFAVLNADARTVELFQHSASSASGYTTVTIPGAGAGPTSMAVGDLDGDGIANDLVVTNGGVNTATVFLMATSMAPVRPGFATADKHSNTISAYVRNVGNSGFSLTPFYTGTPPSIGSGPNAIAAGNLAGAKNSPPDLITVDSFSGDTSLVKHCGAGRDAGDGFPPAVARYCTTATVIPNTGTSSSPNPSGIAAGDLNGDGIPDLVVANTEDRTLSLLVNDGSGTFIHSIVGPTGFEPVAVPVGNLGGKGPGMDIAVANSSGAPGSVSLFLHNPATAGGYDITTLQAGREPNGIALGDLNGDGRTDIAVTNQLDNTLTIYIKNPLDPAYTSATMATGPTPPGLAIGDLSGHGKIDLATANEGDGTVSLFLKNDNKPGYKTKTLKTGGSSPSGVVIGPMGGDGGVAGQDLAVTNQTSNTVTFFLRKSDDSTGYKKTTLRTGNQPVTPVLADLNGDGHLGLAYVNSIDAEVGVFINPGDGFVANPLLDLGGASQANGAMALAAANLTGHSNGALDLATVARFSNTCHC